MNKKGIVRVFITRGTDKVQEVLNEKTIKKFWTGWSFEEFSTLWES